MSLTAPFLLPVILLSLPTVRVSGLSPGQGDRREGCARLRPGVATALVAAIAPEFQRSGWHDLDGCREACTVPNDADLSAHSHGVKKWVLDPRSCAGAATSLREAR
jgi:hypothetical protein